MVKLPNKKGTLYFMGFKAFHLHPDIESGIEAMGYTEPTPIQKECIPVVL